MGARLHETSKLCVSGIKDTAKTNKDLGMSCTFFFCILKIFLKKI